VSDAHPGDSKLVGDELRRAHVSAFLAAGLAVTAEREVVRLAGAALELHERLIARFRALGGALGAERREYPVLLPTAVLARTSYFLSFPHQATFAAPVDPAEVPAMVDALERGVAFADALHRRTAVPERILSPAVCYHCYAELAGGRVDGPLRVVQATGRCFRHEDAEARRPLARQREFVMHELILLGEEQPVADARTALCRRVTAMAARARLAAEVVPAQDPFYGSVQGRALGMMQRVTGSKLELVVDAGDGPLAIASFNLHGDYFGQALGIGGGGGVLFTGCVAFGIERWMCALIAAHGPDPDAWWQAIDEMEDP
jgi:hypothetical protein